MLTFSTFLKYPRTMKYSPDDIHIDMGSCSHTIVVGMRLTGREFDMLVVDEPST